MNCSLPVDDLTTDKEFSGSSQRRTTHQIKYLGCTLLLFTDDLTPLQQFVKIKSTCKQECSQNWTRVNANTFASQEYYSRGCGRGRISWMNGIVEWRSSESATRAEARFETVVVWVRCGSDLYQACSLGESEVWKGLQWTRNCTRTV